MPKITTNKVTDDAVHLIVGFEHESKSGGVRWNFTRWDLVDLAHFRVRLKAEFQGSNRGSYGRGHNRDEPEVMIPTAPWQRR